MSTKSVGKPLSIDLIFTKTKSDNLQNIKNLNLWGNELQDLKILQKMPNLEVISLSVNKINTLKDFSNCHKLQELYLRKNNIMDISQIKHLVNLPVLKVLWLHDNPCSQIQDYREIVIRNLPNLIKLDNNPITPQQRQASQKMKNIMLIDEPLEQQYQNLRSKVSLSNQSNLGRLETDYPHLDYIHNPPQQNSRYVDSEEQKINENRKKRASQGSQQQQHQVRQKKQNSFPSEEQIRRNQNILMAIISLMRDLDPGSLEILRREIDKKLY